MAEEVEKAQEQEQKEPPVVETTGEEEKKTEAGKRRKSKKQYSAEEFVHPQPRIKKQPFPIVYRSRKWFKKNHPLVDFKRDDPHKEEIKGEGTSIEKSCSGEGGGDRGKNKEASSEGWVGGVQYSGGLCTQ